ncbi:MAG TPA: OmpA family protein [Polyangia bacterium]
MKHRRAFTAGLGIGLSCLPAALGHAPLLAQTATVTNQAAVPAEASGLPGTSDVGPRFGPRDIASRGGSVGLTRQSAADVGRRHQLRLGVGGEFFQASEFLVSAPGSSGDRNTRLRGTIVASGTPAEFLELFGAVTGSANRNRRICGTGAMSDICRSETGRADPEVIRTSAAVNLGAKTAAQFGERVALGAELGVRLLPSLGGVLFDGDSTSGWLTGLSRFDLGGLAAAPLRAHLSAGFFLDNSYELRGAAGETASSRLVSAFAYGMGRSRVQGALGLEAPLRDRWLGQLVRPSVEYHVDVVTADADPALTIDPRKNRDRHWLTFGLDVQSRGGLTVSAGFDLGLRRASFAYGPPVAPQNFMLSVGQAIDLSGPTVVTRVVERPVPVATAPAPREGFVRGTVVGPTGPIEGALVKVRGQAHPRVATEADGSFRSAGLPPGPVVLEIMAPNFQVIEQPAEIAAGREASIAVTLAPVQKPIAGRFSDLNGRPAAARLVLVAKGSNAAPIELAADETGAFQGTLAAGSYQGHVTSERFLGRPVSVRVDDDGAPLELALRPRPEKPRVTLDGGAAKFSRPLRFVVTPATTTAPEAPVATLTPDSIAMLDELVDLLVTRPPTTKIRVRAHWDAGADEAEAKRVTEAQAAGVLAHLARVGVARDRVDAAGVGAAEPLADQPRNKNRRVEITLVD